MFVLTAPLLMQENLAYLEAESLIAESYQLAKGAEAEVTPESLESWCMQDSAAVRQVNCSPEEVIQIYRIASQTPDEKPPCGAPWPHRRPKVFWKLLLA